MGGNAEWPLTGQRVKIRTFPVLLALSAGEASASYITQAKLSARCHFRNT